nr:MAG: hypothetical protein [Molluscum contagiosum virus]
MFSPAGAVAFSVPLPVGAGARTLSTSSAGATAFLLPSTAGTAVSASLPTGAGSAPASRRSMRAVMRCASTPADLRVQRSIFTYSRSPSLSARSTSTLGAPVWKRMLLKSVIFLSARKRKKVYTRRSALKLEGGCSTQRNMKRLMNMPHSDSSSWFTSTLIQPCLAPKQSVKKRKSTSTSAFSSASTEPGAFTLKPSEKE